MSALRRNPIRRHWLAVAALALALPALSLAQQHPSHERGVRPEKAYQFGEFDNVNLLNGNVSLNFALGQSFPVNEKFSYGLALIYNSKAWDFQEATWQGQIHSQAVPDRFSNAGMGWSVSLGRLVGPDSPYNDYRTLGWVYFGPDGADHFFHKGLHETGTASDYCATQGECFTRDGSYLRLRVVDNVTKEIDFPDGTVHVFTRFVVGAQWEWRLTAMRDHFDGGFVPNEVAISYSADGNVWTLTDRFGRVQKITFQVAAGDRYKRRVKEVEVAGVGTSTQKYIFDYFPLAAIRVPCGNTLPGWQDVKASQLSSVTLPDQTVLSFTYYGETGSGTCHARGVIRQVTLPTGGKVEYTYRDHTLPVTGCSFRTWFKNSAAVHKRTFLNRSGGTLAAWEYTALLSDPPTRPSAWCGQTGNTYSPPSEQLTVTVKTPLGDKLMHFFSVWPGDEEGLTTTSFQIVDYGLPFTRLFTDDDDDERFKSTETVDCNASGESCVNPRISYVRYERDAQGACSLALDTSCTDVNRRQASEKTVFEDGKWASNDSTEFDGFGHYGKQTLAGNFGSGDAAVIDTQYNANDTDWILHIVDAESTTVGGAVAKREYCVDRGTGFVSRARWLRESDGSRDPEDVLVVYSDEVQPNNWEGNVKSEEYFGGDGASLGTGPVCDVSPGANRYRIDHEYSYGVRATSRYVDAGGAALSYYTLQQAVDFQTGFTLSSTSGGGPTTAGLVTTYEYDDAGRLSWVKRAAGHGAWVNYRYTTDADTDRRAVTVEEHLNGQTTSGVVTEATTVYDDLGRPWLQRRHMPDGSWSQQQTLYNGMGWQASVSEVADKNSDPADVALTQYTDYDPYGRPRKVIHPDLSETTRVYTGVSKTTRTVKVGTAYNPSTQQVTTDDAVTDSEFDRRGRLWKVTERSGPATALPVTTAYAYDVGGRLSNVCSKPTGAEAECVQERRFVYDNRGFLTAERHPEKGTNGLDGWVTYLQIDARGHAGKRLDGSDPDHDLLFEYDRGERLIRVRENGTNFTSCDAAGPRCLKEFAYGTTNSGGDWLNGKLWTATRYNYATLESTAYKIKVRETYAYQGRDGRPSRRNTHMYLNGGAAEAFTQTFDYDDLGDVTGLGYPACINCGGTLTVGVAPSYSRGFMTAIPEFVDSITYHPNGMVFKVTHANQVVDVQELSANSIARPRQLLSKQLGFVRWDSGVFKYDAAGDVTQTGAAWYTYDLAQRITQARIFEGPKGDGVSHTQAYEFDPYGNLKKITTDGSARPIPTSSATNRLDDGSTTYGYDPAGNLTCWQRSGSSCSATFQYDSLNMVSRMTSGGEDWIYVYTADDERFFSYRVAAAPTKRWTLRDLDGKVLREYQADPTGFLRVRRDYFYGGDRGLLASEGEGTSLHFVDIWTRHWAAAEIEALYAAGITAGCVPPPGTPAFCPDLAMTREQMAVFLIKGSSPPNYEPPACTVAEFNDVPCSNNFAPWIYELKRRGITNGCGNGSFCPQANVTKGQMAVFTLAAQGVTPPACQGNIFNDFTCAQPPYFYASHVEEAYRRGIDLGCGNGNFCPEEVITRAKAAVWLTRAFNLPIPDSGFTRHYHLDHLQSPRLVTSSAGTPLAYHVYYPFGEEATSLTQDNERLKFTGHERDFNGQTGATPAADDLDYMHARYYKPLLGRFLSVDRRTGSPGLPQSWNRYSYTYNNPLRFDDPNGEKARVIVDGSKVRIEVPVRFGGDAMTPERIDAYKRAVESTWSGRLGKYEVTTVVTKGGFWDNHVTFSSVSAKKKRSFASLARFATIYTEDTPAAQAFVDAHETGHLMHMDDKYDQKTGDVFPGWEGNIMAVHLGVPWGANLRELFWRELGREWEREREREHEKIDGTGKRAKRL